MGAVAFYAFAALAALLLPAATNGAQPRALHRPSLAVTALPAGPEPPPACQLAGRGCNLDKRQLPPASAALVRPPYVRALLICLRRG
jgi:hypothetical protein